MGRHLHYKPGSFYRKDDQTGFPERAERTRKQWDGAIVSGRVFDPRQPQDFVRGRRDNQTVPDARPLPPDSFVGPTYLTLTQAAGPAATVLHVDTVAGAQSGLAIRVVLDSGVSFATSLSGAPGASTVTLATGLPSSASVGALAVLLTSNPGV